MKDEIFFLMVFVIAIGAILGAVIYHEYMWVTEASDYDVCMSACRNSLSHSGVGPDARVDCFEMCLSLSDEQVCACRMEVDSTLRPVRCRPVIGG